MRLRSPLLSLRAIPRRGADIGDEGMIARKCFISSTIYDLTAERERIRKVLTHSKLPGVKMECVMSEYPDFRKTPTALADKHSFEICLQALRESDYFILLLKKRYGLPVIPHDGEYISITHREYREAYDKRLPMFIFVDQRTWNAQHRVSKGLSQSFVPSKQLRLFEFLEEVRRKPRSNWIHFYRNLNELKTVFRKSLFEFDDSWFVADVTVPDGTIVRVGEVFEKTWEIENRGLVQWQGRYLQEENPGISGLVPESLQIPVPPTMPGERVRLTARFRAPLLPGSCDSYWKMRDEYGKYCFQHLSGVYCRVKAVF